MVNSTEARISNKLLKWAREHEGLTLDVAAEKMEVELNLLADWESGKSFPTFDQLLKISQVYELPVRLFYLSELPPKTLFKPEMEVKKAVEYLKSKGFTPDDYKNEWGDEDDTF